MNIEEAELKAEELVKLTLEQKDIADKIKQIKGELLEFTELENISDYTWRADNGCVEMTTTTKYTLAEVEADVKISPNVVAIDVGERAFDSKIVLSKEGKKMFREQHPSIVNLMIPSTKRNIKVIV
jgi:hypothetical protein